MTMTVCNSMQHQPPAALRLRRRAAFTLLEMVLALAVSVLVISATTMAVTVVLRAIERGRQSVEEAQLARALLRRIADDIRGTIVYQPMDVKGMMSSATSSGLGGDTLAGATGAAASSGGTTGSTDPATSGAADEGITGGDTGGTGDESSSGQPAAIPGLYGDAYNLELDVSRLPRLDEYQVMTEDGLVAAMVTDVKTVAYYVVEGDRTITPTLKYQRDANSPPGGLMRRELDRATSLFAAQSGDFDSLEAAAVLVAMEVLAIEFRYYNGAEWLNAWDTSTEQGLPVAVEVAIAISRDPTVSAVELNSLFDAVKVDQGSYSVYRLLVHIPSTEPGGTAAAAADAEAASGDSTDTGGSGASGSGASGSGASGSTGGTSGAAGS